MKHLLLLLLTALAACTGTAAKHDALPELATLRTRGYRVVVLPFAVSAPPGGFLSESLAPVGELLARLKERLTEASSQRDGLLLLTDLEALHPYLRINSIEAQLQNQVRCPVIVLYPGSREGKTSLRFVGFYPADPNYRSEHIG